jgi:hypothetical protein
MLEYFQDFEMANHAVSFFILTGSYPDDIFEDISIDNVKTNEKLVIKNIDDDEWSSTSKLLVSRYPLNAAKSWIEANEKEIAEWNGEELDRKIILQDGLTIGI